MSFPCSVSYIVHLPARLTIASLVEVEGCDTISTEKAAWVTTALMWVVGNG